MLRGRIAPTPSGYLHIGNALNFVLTWLWVRKKGEELRLRIDDSDTTRSKPDYIQDIFQTLEWLGLDWDEGPQTPDEQLHQYSQALRAERYRTIIHQLITTGQVFACECSRKVLQTRGCDCRDKGIDFGQPDTSLRITTPVEPVSVYDVKLGTQLVVLREEMKDFVIRRRDGIKAYQLCSLTDDMDHHINLIIRGEDLLTSTAGQLYLASLLPANNFASTQFYHHALLYDVQGQKLSKSAGSLSLKTLREQGMSTQVLYARISSLLGWKNTYGSLSEMLNSEESVI